MHKRQRQRRRNRVERVYSDVSRRVGTALADPRARRIGLAVIAELSIAAGVILWRRRVLAKRRA